MTLPMATEPIPLVTDADGVVRVGGTRVTLDTLVAAFEEGATAEEIVQQYPSLHLADVYAVLGYYLRRRPAVEAYLRQRQQQAREVRRQNEARFDPRGVRCLELKFQAKSSSALKRTSSCRCMPVLSRL